MSDKDVSGTDASSENPFLFISQVTCGYDVLIKIYLKKEQQKLWVEILNDKDYK